MIQQTPSSSRVVILSAIDGSDASADVLRTSATIARTLAGAELHLLHVVEPTPDPEARIALLRSLTELLEDARISMERHMADARASFSGKIVSHLAAGIPWQDILQLAADLQADLIVVGSNRKKMVERWLLGSVSEQVVRKASCAVLVARPKEYGASAVPEIEPPCADCLATQEQTSAARLWCSRHDRSRAHPKGHVHYKMPEPFAVGSLLIRPEE